MSSTTNFKQIRCDYESGQSSYVDTMYEIIKDAIALGGKSKFHELGDQLIQELRSYVDAYDPACRSFPVKPPSQEQVDLIRSWLDN